MIKLLWNEIRQLDTGRKTLRSFGVTVGAVFLLIAGVVFWRSGWSTTTAVYVLGGVGGALILFGMAVPQALKHVYRIWMGLALVLGFVMTRVILTLVFYLTVTPTALVMRLLGKDLLNRKLDRRADSYWLPKTYDNESPSRLEKYY